MADAYRGRFAPSPTGPLHFGSLVSAVASYLDARQHQGTWIIRIEDVDGTRCSINNEKAIIETLNSYHLSSDEDIIRQSERSDLYQHYLEQLIAKELAYPCQCTRASLTEYNGLHPQQCLSTLSEPHSWRALCQQKHYQYLDPIQGLQTFDLDQPRNHPILKRKDGFFSYQLAVVVDDHLQDISHIVRGADLLDTTGQQLWLYETFHWQPPKMVHLPLIVNQRGDKISKQNHAKAIPNGEREILMLALQYLGFSEIPHDYNCLRLLDWATLHWNQRCLQGMSLHLSDADQHLIE